MYIHCFEQHIASLRLLRKNGMTTVIANQLAPEYEAEKLDMINEICSNPCIARLIVKRVLTFPQISPKKVLVVIYVNIIVITRLLWHKCTGKWREVIANFSYQNQLCAYALQLLAPERLVAANQTFIPT